jgi:hypothetical protein
MSPEIRRRDNPKKSGSGGVMKVATITSSVQVSGVRCQQLKSIRWVGVALEMYFVSPVLAFSRNQISVQDSGFVFS